MSKPQLKDFRNICIIQTAFLGDVALALPLAQVIRNYHPDARITFVSTPIAGGITSSIPAINNILTYDKRGIRKGIDGIRHMATVIKEMNADLILSCHRSLRTSLLAGFLRPIYSVGYDISSLSLLYSTRVKYIKPMHEIERNLRLLSAFDDFKNINTTDIQVSIDFAYEDRVFVDSMLLKISKNQDKIISIFPGSVWETKCWKKEHFVHLISKLSNEGYTCILNGSESEVELCDEISNQSGAVSLAGKLSLTQSIYLISCSQLVITNDSAPTHLAFLADTPTVTIYGPTSPIFGFSPLAKNSLSVGLEDLKCRPCEIHGNKECPIHTHECMENLTPESVFESCKKILSTTPDTQR